MISANLFDLPVPPPTPAPDLALALVERQRGRELAAGFLSCAAGNFKPAVKALGLAEPLCRNPLLYGLLLLLRARLNDAEFVSALVALGETYLASLAAQKNAKAEAAARKKAKRSDKKAATSPVAPSAPATQAPGIEPASEPDIALTPEAAGGQSEPSLEDISEMAPTAPDVLPEATPAAPVAGTRPSGRPDLFASLADAFAAEEFKARETALVSEVAAAAAAAEMIYATGRPSREEGSDVAPTAPDSVPEETPVAPADETSAGSADDLLAFLAHVFTGEEPNAPETIVASDVAVFARDPAANVVNGGPSGAAVATTGRGKPLRFGLPPVPTPAPADAKADEERTEGEADQSNAPASTP